MATQKEQKERERTRREELGKFFYDLAKTTFAAMVVGSLMTAVSSQISPIACITMFVVGTLVTFGFAFIGNKILTD